MLSDITVCKAPGSNDSNTYVGLSGAEWLSGLTAQNGPQPDDLCELSSPLADDGTPGPAFAAGQVPNIQKMAPVTPGVVSTVEGQTILTNGYRGGGRAGTPGNPGALAPDAKTHPVQVGQALRLQLVNCATTRYFRLRLTYKAGEAHIPLIRIGGEGGLLNRAVLEGGTLSNGGGSFDTRYEPGEILIPPSARADVVFVVPPGASPGDVLTLWTRDFQRTGGGFSGIPTVPAMHFSVTGTLGTAFSITGGNGNTTGTQLRAAIPGQEVTSVDTFTGDLLDPGTFVPPKLGTNGTPAQLQDIRLTSGGGIAGINNIPGDFSGVPVYTNVPTPNSARYAESGDTVELTINNQTQAHHPFHLHGFSFQPKSMTGPGGTYVWPYPEFVDVLNVPASHQLKIAVPLEDRPLADGVTPGGALGRWLFHCHIFFHAHSGMISELIVTNSAGGLGSEKPNVDVGGSWAYAPINAVAERRGTFAHRDGDAVTLSATLGTVIDTGGGTWYWSLDTTGLGASTQYVYIEAEDADGRKDQTVFRLKIAGADDGSDSGDPHIRTVDGLLYDFQAVGEFTLLRDREGMELQVRQTPVPSATPIADPHSGLKLCVSVNTAVAARVGSHRVSYQSIPEAQSEQAQLVFFVDGKPTRLTSGGIDLDGHRVSAFDANGQLGLRVDYAHQPVLMVTPRLWSKHQIWIMDVSVSHTQADAGLMGTVPPGSWLPALRNGSAVGPMPRSSAERYAVLYRTFAESWRVGAGSLFVYQSGTSTETFTDRDWPAEKPPCKLKPGFEPPQDTPMGPISEMEAKQVCALVTDPDLNANCVFDVSTTGDKSDGSDLRRRARLAQPQRPAWGLHPQLLRPARKLARPIHAG